MSEPPIRTSPDGVEAGPIKIGHRWLDLILAGSAILISVVSLLIAVKHGAIYEKLVAANSWPILALGSGNIDDKTGKAVIALMIRNDGSGPALLKHVTISYKDRQYPSTYAFLRACCDWPQYHTRAEAMKSPIITSRISGTVIPAQGESTVLIVPQTAFNTTEWERLDQERFKLQFKACYCSVLGECWTSDLQGAEPKSVKSCPTEGGVKQ